MHSQRTEQNSIRNIQKRAEKAESQYLPVRVTGRAQEVVTRSHPEESCPDTDDCGSGEACPPASARPKQNPAEGLAVRKRLNTGKTSSQD
jgi:hypothetical protein